MEETIVIPIQEIDNRLVFWKTRLVELTTALVPLMMTGNKKALTIYLKIKCLNMYKKTLRDYRFEKIYLTKTELTTCIQKGNELASIY